MVSHPRMFRLSGEQSITQWLDIFSAMCAASVMEKTPVKRQKVLLETFDWALHGAGVSLWAAGNAPVQLTMISSKKPLNFPADLEVPELPKVASDLPEGGFREKLNSLLGLRALLPLVTLEETLTPLAISNNEGVEQVRMELLDVVQKPGPRRKPIPLGQFLAVWGYAGYEAEFEDCLQRLDTFEAITSISNDDFIELTLKAVNRTPGDYSSKLKVHLERDMRSDEALKCILLDQLGQIETNLEGTIANWDTEFLHDLRVALRRQRSALSRIKDVLPASMAEKFAGELKWVGSATTPVRDLDVYLLDLPGYKAALPCELQDNLDPLIEHVQKQYEQARANLLNDLKSKRFKDFMSRWRAFLEKPVPARPSAGNALLPIGELADQQIWKTYKKVIKEGRAISENSPAEALHDLRKTCKKLRYLLEFFQSLYPEKDHALLVKHLKKLQSNLGDYQDLDVQKETLYEYAEQMSAGGETRPKIYMSMGILIRHFIVRKQEVQDQFDSQFNDFASKDVKKLFKKLVKS